VDLLIAGLFYLPILFLWGWHGLSDRGDRALRPVLTVIIFVAGYAFVVVQQRAGWWQVAADVVGAGLCATAIALHRQSMRTRIARGEIPAHRERRSTRGWRLWARGVLAALCFVSAIGIATGEVRVRINPEAAQRRSCGSITDALGADDRCAAEARMHLFGIVVLVGGGGLLALPPLLHRRRQ